MTDRTCPNCGAPFGDSARCDYCGAPNPYYDPEISRCDAVPVTLHETEVVECRFAVDPYLAGKLSDEELLQMASKHLRDKLLQALLRNVSIVVYDGDASTMGAKVVVGRVHVVKHDGVLRKGVQIWR